MKLRPVIASLAIDLAVVLLAFFAAAALERQVGIGEVAASLIVALVVAAVFAWRPIDGLITFAIAVLMAQTFVIWIGLEVRYLDEVTVPLLILTALLFHRSRLHVPAIGARELALGVLFLAGIASSLAGSVPVEVWVPGLGLLAKGFAFLYLVATLEIGEDDLRRCTGTILAIGLVIIAIGLVQFVSPEFASAYLGVHPVSRQRGSIEVINSVFTHPALYGWFAIYLALFLFARFAVLREWWTLVLALALGAAGILSGRRTPVIGLIVGLLAAMARQATSLRNLSRTVLAALLLITVVAAVATPLLGDFYRSTFVDYATPPEIVAEIFSDEPDAKVIKPLAARNALYLGAVAIARDHLPLGAGLGRFGSQMSRQEYSPLYAEYGLQKVNGLRERRPIAVTDTFWPMILGETGLIGLLGALAFFGLLGRHLWQAARPTLEPWARAFTLGSFIVFVDSLVRSLTSPIYVAPPIMYFVFGAAGLALAVARSEPEGLSN